MKRRKLGAPAQPPPRSTSFMRAYFFIILFSGAGVSYLCARFSGYPEVPPANVFVAPL